jgi:alcohol dehydrogenase YqhD (iron-dependent ADH family)
MEEGDNNAVIEAGIRRMEDYFKSIGLPTRLGDIDIDDSRLEEMAGKATSLGEITGMKTLTKEDVIEIYKLANNRRK